MLRPLAALVLLAGLALGARLAVSPPAPRGEDAPPGEFSAARALGVLRALAADGATRWPGGAANARAVVRIEERLRALGLEPERQAGFACGVSGACARVVNLLARVPGRGRPVLLAAHHDSVAAGAGVADDLSGVAALLEVARALRAGPTPSRPVILLFTDGEEEGLVGARLFEASPLASEVAAVVNLEARGTSGPSLLFETSGDPPFVARVLARMPRPLSTSLFDVVYARLPNDTDLTVLRARGRKGLNLAFGSEVVRYHTPLDDLAHMELASLQHQGENALAAVRALDGEDLEAPGRPRVWFDVLSLGVVSYPSWAALPLAVLAAASALAGGLVLARRGGLRLREAAWGAGAALGALVLAGLLAAGIIASLRWAGAFPRLFVASPGWSVAAAWCAAAGAALLVPALAALRARAEGLLAGNAALLAAAAIASSAALPGASYVAGVPALAAGLGVLGVGLARDRSRGARLAAALAPALAAGILGFPLAWLLPEFLGPPGSVALSLPVALAVTGLAPLFPPEGRGRLFPGAVALAAALALALVAASRPHASEDAPERVNVAFHEEAGEARWLVETETDDLAASFRAAAKLSARRERPFPWTAFRRAFVARAPALGLAAPKLEVLATREEGELRRVRARLSSPRGAPVTLLLLPPGARLSGAWMEGVALPPPTAKALAWFGGWRLVGCATTPAAGVEVELLLGPGPVEALVVDQSFGLPPAGAPLAAARPRSAVPSQDGDVTVSTARVRL
jgi:hypothetical protein